MTELSSFDIVKATYLNPKKRLSRAGYFLGLTLLNLLTYALSPILFIPSTPYYLSFFLFGVYALIYTYSAFVLITNRLHDIGHSGWLSILSFVPFFNVAFWIYLLSKEGSDGVNEFGEPCSFSSMQFLTKVCPVLVFGMCIHFVLVDFFNAKNPHEMVFNMISGSESLQHSIAFISVHGDMIPCAFITENRVVVKGKDLSTTVQNELSKDISLDVINAKNEKTQIKRFIASDEASEISVFEVGHSIGVPSPMNEKDQEFLESINAFE